MANTYWEDRTSEEIVSSHISGLQDAVKNIEQSLDMDTEAVSEESLTLLADASGSYRIAEAVGKRNWLNDPAPVVEWYNGATWETISTGFTIDYAGGALIFTEDKTGEQYRASFTRVKNTSGHNTHLLDYVLQIPFGGTSTNVDDDYSIATPAIDALAEGMAVCFKCNADSSGATTLNWDSKGAKSIKKANGTDVTNLKNGGIYTLRYDGVNFILQGEGASGDATASDLLSGKTATVDAGEITGTMPNRGTVNYNPSASNQTIQEGYHSGSGIVYAADPGVDIALDNISIAASATVTLITGGIISAVDSVTTNIRLQILTNGTWVNITNESASTSMPYGHFVVEANRARIHNNGGSATNATVYRLNGAVTNRYYGNLAAGATTTMSVSGIYSGVILGYSALRCELLRTGSTWVSLGGRNSYNCVVGRANQIRFTNTYGSALETIISQYAAF